MARLPEVGTAGLPNPLKAIEELRDFVRGLWFAMSLVFLIVLGLAVYVVVRRV